MERGAERKEIVQWTILVNEPAGQQAGRHKFLDSSGNTTFDNNSLLNRGYTGHEHFFGVALIHMNGRMYDAKLGRFLSPDNFIQNPNNTQNFNRYGYVLNNPLMYSDPSGEFIITAMIIGAIIGGVSAAVSGQNIFLGAVIGAISGLVSAGVGNVAAGGAFFGKAAIGSIGFWSGAGVGAMSGLAGGFTGGALNSWTQGGSFMDGIVAGAMAGASGALIGAAVGGVVGGVRASKQNSEFWSGSPLKEEVNIGGNHSFYGENTQQHNQYDCVTESLERYDEHFQISRENNYYNDLRNQYSKGVSNQDFKTYFEDAHYEIRYANTPEIIKSQLRQGNPVLVKVNTGVTTTMDGVKYSYRHAKTIIGFKSFDNGKNIWKLYNPATGTVSSSYSLPSAAFTTNSFVITPNYSLPSIYY